MANKKGHSMKKGLIVALALSFAPSCFAQLTQDQKVQDFKALAAQYDRNYSNYQWKLKAFGVDALDLQPWLDKIYASSDDLSFYDIEVRYVASLHDAHDEATLFSTYEAFLPLTADIYDGDVLIDFIDTTSLDPAAFPVQIGDQLLSVDGVDMSQWITQLAPYTTNGRGNPVSGNRLATGLTLDRYQGWYPYAGNTKPGAIARLKIKSQVTGKTQTYDVPWTVVGTPVTQEGPAANFGGGRARRLSMQEELKLRKNLWQIHNVSSWMPRPRASSQGMSRSADGRRHVQASRVTPTQVTAGAIFPFDSPIPSFNPPPGFQLRLGADPSDNFVSGSFPVNGKTMGYIRIPTFEPTDEALAEAQILTEVTWFQQNTAGLVIDIMGNGGGDSCYALLLEQLFETQPFWGLNAEPRPSENWIEYYSEELLAEQSAGAPQPVIDAYQSYITRLQQALARNDRNTSGPLPLCAPGLYIPPATDDAGNSLAYSKPILLLTDNFTFSSAEFFAAGLQDSGRATVYGTRTNGGGATVVPYSNAGAHSETNIRISEALIIRSRNVTTPGYPTAPYIENIGVYPDVPADFQTRANLLTGGQPFVSGFVAAIDRLTNSNSPH
jgi:hypothetical protein